LSTLQKQPSLRQVTRFRRAPSPNRGSADATSKTGPASQPRGPNGDCAKRRRYAQVPPSGSARAGETQPRAASNPAGGRAAAAAAALLRSTPSM